MQHDALLALARALDKLILCLKHNSNAAEWICSFDFDNPEHLNRADINRLLIDAGLADREIITVEQRPHAGCRESETIIHVTGPFGEDARITASAPTGLGAYPRTPDRVAMLAICIEAWRSECARQLATEPVPPVSSKPPASDPALSKSQQYALIALLELGATEPNKRRTAAEVVAQAGGKLADLNSYKRPLRNLKTLGLVNSHSGQAGGYWLTEAGIPLAEKLRGKPPSQ